MVGVGQFAEDPLLAPVLVASGQTVGDGDGVKVGMSIPFFLVIVKVMIAGSLSFLASIPYFLLPSSLV